jgi:hypothetical protein
MWALTFSGNASLLYSLGAYEEPVLIPGDEPIPPKLLTYSPMTLQVTKYKFMHKIFLIQPKEKTYKEKTLEFLIKYKITLGCYILPYINVLNKTQRIIIKKWLIEYINNKETYLGLLLVYY